MPFRQILTDPVAGYGLFSGFHENHSHRNVRAAIADDPPLRLRLTLVYKRTPIRTRCGHNVGLWAHLRYLSMLKPQHMCTQQYEQNVRRPNFDFRLDSIRFTVKTSTVKVERLSRILKYLFKHAAGGIWSRVSRSIGPATIFYSDGSRSGEKQAVRILREVSSGLVGTDRHTLLNCVQYKLPVITFASTIHQVGI